MRSRMMALVTALKMLVFSKYTFIVNTCNKFHSSQGWHRFNKQVAESSLGLVYLPRQSKFDLIRRRRKKKDKEVKKKVDKTEPLLIACKRKVFNHYLSTRYNNTDEIPLACRSWGKKKSNGDYFSILPTSENPAFIYPEGLECPPDSFRSLGICEEFVQKLIKIGIQRPTFVQYAAIPRIIAGEHVLLNAEAGSGKTLAYVLPMLENIRKHKPEINMNYNSPLGVIVVPTRELALQVEGVIKSLVEDTGINCEVLLSNYTNNFLLNMTSDFIKNVDIAVCTPGIMCKLTYHKIYSLSGCLNLVFDEADMLLDDTFIRDARALFSRTNFGFNNVNSAVSKGTQLSLVSATIPYEIHERLNEVFPSHLLQNITTRYVHRTLPHVTHKFIRCSKADRVTNLLNLVKTYVEKNEPVILFSNRTKTCNWLVHFLRENNIECARCNAHMSYEERVDELKKFQEGKVNVISSSDLISRGHNIIQIQHVINFEFPMFIADYMHRSGRTGRIGISECQNACNVTSFICSKNDALLLKELELSVRRNNTIPHMNSNMTGLLKNSDSLKKKTKKKK